VHGLLEVCFDDRETGCPPICFCGLAIACSHATTFSKCDVNQDGVTTVADVQKEINQALELQRQPTT